MKRKWITKEGNRVLTLFFCGWGMDEHTVQHVRGMGDLLLFYDYRDISGEDAPEVEGYESVRVVAWSMGVWAASVLLSRWNIPVSCRVAINGTERPVDEHYGIHPKIYLLTERGMTEQGRDKFFARMFSGKEEMERFKENRPCRAIDEQRDELRLIREQFGTGNARNALGAGLCFRGGCYLPGGKSTKLVGESCRDYYATGGTLPVLRVR